MARTFLFSILLLAVVATAGAQTEQTLASSARVRGGFGGPLFTVSNLDGQWSVGGGGGGGFIFNDFFFGGYGQGDNFSDWTLADGRPARLVIGSGGLWLGYVHRSPRIFHLYTSLKIGGGEIKATEPDNEHHDGDVTLVKDAILTVQPEAGVEVNLTHWFRLAFTGGYRVVGGVNHDDELNRRDFSSPTLALTLRFGHFGYE